MIEAKLADSKRDDTKRLGDTYLALFMKKVNAVGSQDCNILPRTCTSVEDTCKQLKPDVWLQMEGLEQEESLEVKKEAVAK